MVGWFSLRKITLANRIYDITKHLFILYLVAVTTQTTDKTKKNTNAVAHNYRIAGDESAQKLIIQ